MRVLFLTADLGGNVPPTLAVAEQVAHRGIDVEVAGLQKGRTDFEEPAFPAATDVGPQGKKGLAKLVAMMRLMAGKKAAAQARDLVVDSGPDAVVVDCMAVAPLRGALDTGLPVAVLFHTIGTFWSQSFDRWAGVGPGLRGFRPGKLWAQAHARLMLTDAELDPGTDDPALTEFFWAGTTEKGAEPAPRADGEPSRVLVTLSATDWPGMLPVYRRIVAALEQIPVTAIVTTGGVDLGGELEGAENVEVRGWADHSELLPSIDLVIGHGGHSTALKVLAHGIPLLVLPVNPTSDQRRVGLAVESAGLGRVLPKGAKSQRIADTVTAMLADTALQERSAANGRRLRAEVPGERLAADRIVALSGAGGGSM